MSVLFRLPAQKLFASVAQLVEQLICNQQVIGSSPFGGSNQIVSWCNGSTSDFGSAGRGSSPCETTIIGGLP